MTSNTYIVLGYVRARLLSDSYNLRVADVQALRESEEKCRQQVVDVTRRESMLLKSLTEKEREIADLAVGY